MKFLVDEVVQAKLATAQKLSDYRAEDYDAVFYPVDMVLFLILLSTPSATSLPLTSFRLGRLPLQCAMVPHEQFSHLAINS